MTETNNRFSALRPIGYAALLAGLLLVILARGCDSIGNRNVARRQALVKLATADFEAKWATREGDLNRQIETLRASDKGDAALMTQYLDQRNKMAKERDAERSKLETESWKDLRFAAETASARNATWSYWREYVFLLGALILTCGLVVMSLAASGPDRWVGLVMLAIIVFSIFVIGSPWLPSIGIR